MEGRAEDGVTGSGCHWAYPANAVEADRLRGIAEIKQMKTRLSPHHTTRADTCILLLLLYNTTKRQLFYSVLLNANIKAMKKRAPNLRSDMDSFVPKKKKKLIRVYDVNDLFTTKEEPRDEHSTEDENDEEAVASGRNTSHGYHMVRGKMDHGMEDYLVGENRKINGHHLGLYAIFDGHSGRDVAKYLQSHLFDNILSQSEFWKNPKRAMKKAYKITDDEILDNIDGSRGGSTAVTAILIDHKRLIVANVGDSRAVLFRNGVARALSVDHEPEKEKEMVERKGGYVSQMPGNVPRVDGQLAMTRAFGDGRLKEHITCEPDLTSEIIDEDDEFLILASDGLWKVMSNQEAYDCIECLQDAQEASEKLISAALALGSKDDISCIVVIFH